MNIPNFLLTLTNPKQLQKIDRYFLLNHPRFWVTKVHYVIYYGILANIILNLLIFAIINPKIIDEFIQYFIVLIMLIEAGIFMFWFDKQSVYNVEKEYGNTSSGIGFVEIIIYALCAVIITSSSLTMTTTAMYRTASLVGMEPSTQCFVQNTKQDTKQDTKSEREKLSAVAEKFETGTDANKNYYNGDVCKNIVNFINGNYDNNDSSYYLPYCIYWWLHTILLMWGIFLLVIRKYSDSGTYASIVFSSMLLIYGSIFCRLVLIEGRSLVLRILAMLLNILLFYQSIRLTKLRRFDDFKFINFAVLPIALGVLISFIVSFLPSHGFMKNTMALIIFFIFYIFVFPIYKASLNRTLALPKE